MRTLKTRIEKLEEKRPSAEKRWLSRNEDEQPEGVIERLGLTGAPADYNWIIRVIVGPNQLESGSDTPRLKGTKNSRAENITLTVNTGVPRPA